MATRIVPEELLDFDSPVAEFFRGLTGPWPFRPLLAFAPGKHFVPVANSFDRDGNLVITMDLPGVDPKDIHVKFEEGMLTVTGERKADKEIKEEGYYRKESSYGLFERRMSVPKGITEEDIKADYVNGVLEISMPRATKIAGQPKAKEIPVNATKQIKA